MPKTPELIVIIKHVKWVKFERKINTYYQLQKILPPSQKLAATIYGDSDFKARDNTNSIRVKFLYFCCLPED